MSPSDVYVKETTTGQWGVFGANLPANACWEVFDTVDEAIADAEELASDFGVRYVGVHS